jgi:hypothetical protein
MDHDREAFPRSPQTCEWPISNGRYVCGRLAGHIDGSVEITLQALLPLVRGTPVLALFVQCIDSR